MLILMYKKIKFNEQNIKSASRPLVGFSGLIDITIKGLIILLSI